MILKEHNDMSADSYTSYEYTYIGVLVYWELWDNRKWWLIYLSSGLWPGKYVYPIIILFKQEKIQSL